MLQSIAKGAPAEKKEEARPATQAFVTEPINAHTIAVGDVAHRNARRAHDSTLVGLAPPPPVHVSSLNTQPLALPQEQTRALRSDDRSLATILVVGTLIAMFAIAFSAVPDGESAAPRAQAPETAAEPAPVRALAAAPVQPTASAGQASSKERALLPIASAEPQAATPKATKPVASRTMGPRAKALTKGDGKVSVRRRVKPSTN